MIEKWEILIFITLWLLVGIVAIKIPLTKKQYNIDDREDIVMLFLLLFGGFFTLIYVILFTYVKGFNGWIQTPFKKKNDD